MAKHMVLQEKRDRPSEQAADPIHSRFLFVDVAAQRANQLIRGARVRIAREDFRQHEAPRTLARIAMEEVRHGLIQYDVPDPSVISRP